MKQVRIDWHIHTTLSPCAGLSMDPRTIIERAKEKDLQVIGITDHNSTRQARIMITEFQEPDLLILAGAEVTTREELHCLVFFGDLDTLDEFQDYLDRHLPDLPNNPSYFGDQVVVNGLGRIVYEESRLLISAIDQSLDQITRFVIARGGLLIPAHINRPIYSLLSQLGMVPRNLNVHALECVPSCKGGLEYENDPCLDFFPLVFSSDAHEPDQIGKRFTELWVDELTFNGIKIGLTMKNKGVN
jgi:3',5'-nucleoside bisphosphate phosphatase